MATFNKSFLIDDPLMKYVCEHALRLTPAQTKLMEATKSIPMCYQMGDPTEIQLLQNLMKLINAKRVIDIGVLTGCSTLSAALAITDDGKVLACDISDEHVKIGKPFWEEAGVMHKIDLRIAPALETLRQCVANGESGTYDFAFIDADKTGYDDYYELCLKLVRSGGVIALDNMLWRGTVLDPNCNEPETVSIKAMNKKLRDDKRVNISLLNLADGVTLAFKI